MIKLLFLGTFLFSTVCLNAQDTESYQEAPNPSLFSSSVIT